MLLIGDRRRRGRLVEAREHLRAILTRERAGDLADLTVADLRRRVPALLRELPRADRAPSHFSLSIVMLAIFAVP